MEFLANAVARFQSSMSPPVIRFLKSQNILCSHLEKYFFLEIILSPLTNTFLEIIQSPWTNIFPIDGNFTKPDNLFPGIGYFEQCPSASPGGI